MMFRLERSCVTSPAWASSFRWNESVFGRNLQAPAIVPGVRPLLPATTSARKTSRRTGWASAASERITSVCSIIRGYWNYWQNCKQRDGRQLPARSLAPERRPAVRRPDCQGTLIRVMDPSSFSTYRAPSIPTSRSTGEGKLVAKA